MTGCAPREILGDQHAPRGRLGSRRLAPVSEIAHGRESTADIDPEPGPAAREVPARQHARAVFP